MGVKKNEIKMEVTRGQRFKEARHAAKQEQKPNTLSHPHSFHIPFDENEPEPHWTQAMEWSTHALQRFVMEWLHDNGWDIRKEKIKCLVQQVIPESQLFSNKKNNENGCCSARNVPEDDEEFAHAAAEAINDIQFLMIPTPTGQVGVRDDRLYYRKEKAFDRKRICVDGRRNGAESSRHAVPQGDTSARLYKAQLPQYRCANVMLQA